MVRNAQTIVTMTFAPSLRWRPLVDALSTGNADEGWFGKVHPTGVPAAFLGIYQCNVVCALTWAPDGALLTSFRCGLSDDGLPLSNDFDVAAFVQANSSSSTTDQAADTAAPYIHDMNDEPGIADGVCLLLYGYVTAMFDSSSMGCPYKLVVRRGGKPVRLMTWFPNGRQERDVSRDDEGRVHGRCFFRDTVVTFNHGKVEAGSGDSAGLIELAIEYITASCV